MSESIIFKNIQTKISSHEIISIWLKSQILHFEHNWSISKPVCCLAVPTIHTNIFAICKLLTSDHEQVLQSIHPHRMCMAGALCVCKAV